MKHAVFIFCFLSSICVVAQPKLFINNLATINIEEEKGIISSKLLKKYITESKNYIGVTSGLNKSGKRKSLSKQALIAKSYDAIHFLEGSLEKANDTLYVSIFIYKASDSSLLWNDRVAARTPVDLDKLFKQIASKIGTSDMASVKFDAEIVKVDLKKRNNGFSIYFGASSGLMRSNLTESDRFPFMFGPLFLFNIRRIFLEVSGNGYIKRIGNIYIPSLTANYLLLNKKHAPYLGAGFGYGLIDYANKDKYSPITFQQNGVMGIIGTGFIANKNSLFSARIGVKMFIPTFELYNTSNLLLGHIDLLIRLQ